MAKRESQNISSFKEKEGPTTVKNRLLSALISLTHFVRIEGMGGSTNRRAKKQ
jgi:hypothetical protein